MNKDVLFADIFVFCSSMCIKYYELRVLRQFDENYSVIGFTIE